VRPAIIGHRGAAAEAPENSMPSFELAIELGADALELDVRRSADGALVVIHDPTLDRTSDRSGEVARLPLAAIREADLGSARDATIPRWPAPVAVPTLEQVFERFPGLEITVDVKDPAAAEDVVRRIEAFDRAGRTILYVEEGTETPAFSGYGGRRATSVPQVRRLVTDPGWPGRVPVREVPEVVHTPLEDDGLDLVTAATVRRFREAGLAVHVWTVDEPTTLRRLAEYQVDGIITNDVRGAGRVLGPADGRGGPRA
jgi:glycerophosphoryl diester phosphodiesterase